MMPTPGRQRVTKLFEAALGLRPGERNEFIHRACEGDEALLAEVKSLVSVAPHPSCRAYVLRSFPAQTARTTREYSR